MDKEATYNYSSGPLLEQPHTYQYSEYKGPAFLKAWEEDRREIISKNDTDYKCDCILCKKTTYNCVDKTCIYFNGLLKQLEANDNSSTLLPSLNTLVKRFEVSKRLYSSYDHKFKPSGNREHHNLHIYLLFAEILDIAYAKYDKLPYLNAFLKIIDIIVAYYHCYEKMQKPRICKLIDNEIKYVYKIAETSGVNL